jgi:gluconokinase
MWISIRGERLGLQSPSRMLYLRSMPIKGLRSPSDKVGPLVYFGRMLDKVRLHGAGELPADYIPNLGEGFDKACIQLLGVKYEDLVRRVKDGGTDEEVLDWVRQNGRALSDQDIYVWNEFMRKRGWNDAASERLIQRKAECGFTDRADIQTFFDFIDADEGRK